MNECDTVWAQPVCYGCIAQQLTLPIAKTTTIIQSRHIYCCVTHEPWGGRTSARASFRFRLCSSQRDRSLNLIINFMMFLTFPTLTPKAVRPVNSTLQLTLSYCFLFTGNASIYTGYSASSTGYVCISSRMQASVQYSCTISPSVQLASFSNDFYNDC